MATRSTAAAPARAPSAPKKPALKSAAKAAAKTVAKTAAKTAAKTGPKTVPTQASVADFIAAVPDEERRADCQAVARLMQAATGEAPVMWGDAIVGFGAYNMVYANGSTLPWPIVGFSPRKTDLTLYLMPGLQDLAPLLQRLGRHKTGKVCLYLKRLSDVDMGVLTELVQASVKAMAGKRAPPVAASAAASPPARKKAKA